MMQSVIHAINGKQPFDLLIRNVQIVNVYTDEIYPGDVAIVGERIAYIGTQGETLQAVRIIDGNGMYCIPGFVDSHMHLESSMLTPPHFAKVVLSWGTTSVMADPHEIANVMGMAGVKALVNASKCTPLRVLLMAPSTIPSSPGYEDSGYCVGPGEVRDMLSVEGVYGLGEVMDFHAVADGDPHMLSVIKAAADTGCILDGHASLLTGRGLQAFRATGIDSDHTLGTAEKLREELALGFTVQVQECMLGEEIVQAMNAAPVQNRICLVTDDVPLPRLMHDGHLSHVVERAIELGLEPKRAIRFATINPAQRMRLYDVGGIAPGMVADLLLVQDLAHPRPHITIASGKVIWQNGSFQADIPDWKPGLALYQSMKMDPLKAEDFHLYLKLDREDETDCCIANLIRQDGMSIRTKHVRKRLPIKEVCPGKALAETDGFLKMGVFNRYGKKQHGLALIDGMRQVSGAVALTYGHDSHNLSIYGGNDADMALAGNEVISMGGGICAARNGKVLSRIPLPVAGLLSEKKPEDLLQGLDEFLAYCREMGFAHRNLLSFFTIMPLAVSPEIKCTDHGLLDVVHKTLLPPVEPIRCSGDNEASFLNPQSKAVNNQSHSQLTLG